MLSFPNTSNHALPNTPLNSPNDPASEPSCGSYFHSLTTSVANDLLLNLVRTHSVNHVVIVSLCSIPSHLEMSPAVAPYLVLFLTNLSGLYEVTPFSTSFKKAQRDCFSLCLNPMRLSRTDQCVKACWICFRIFISLTEYGIHGWTRQCQQSKRTLEW